MSDLGAGGHDDGPGRSISSPSHHEAVRRTGEVDLAGLDREELGAEAVGLGPEVAP